MNEIGQWCFLSFFLYNRLRSPAAPWECGGLMRSRTFLRYILSARSSPSSPSISLTKTRRTPIVYCKENVKL